MQKSYLVLCQKSDTINNLSETIKNEIKTKNNLYWGSEVIIEAIERGIDDFGNIAQEWDKPITRAEIAYISIIASITTSDTINLQFYDDMGCVIGDYGDCLASDYCYPILIMYSSGIACGIDENRSFMPNNNATRAEACTIISRLINANERIDASSYNLIYEDAPFFNQILKYGYSESGITNDDADYSYLYSIQKGNVENGSYGNMTAKQIAETQNVVNSFVANYIRPSMPDIRKVAIAAEYIMANCDYGSDNATSPTNAWGALVDGAAWCTGYSYAFKMLCDAMDIGCAVVPANSLSSNPSHQWNEVKIDGNWYIIDIQAGDLGRDSIYLMGDFFPFTATSLDFLISADTYIERNGMMWDMDKYPVCKYDYFEE